MCEPQDRGGDRSESNPRLLRAAPPRAAHPGQMTYSPHPLALLSASPCRPPARDKDAPLRANRVARPASLFSLAPARIRARKVLSVTVCGCLQVPFFHRSEIIRLDTGFRPNVREKGAKRPLFRLATC